MNESCLHICARRGYIELFKLLFKLGASRDVLDQAGRKPIDIAK